MEDNFVITEINRVIMVGEEEYPAGMVHFLSDVTCNELIFHFSGEAIVYFGDLVLKTAPNTVRFLPKGQVSRYDVLMHDRGECIDIFFQTDRPVSSCAFVSNVSQNEKIATLFKKLFSTWVSKSEGYYFDSVSLLYSIFAELQKNAYAPPPHVKKIEPALKMLHEDFLRERFSLGELAAACGMGNSYFQKLFREIYGMSPKKYMIQLKINHACDLLRLGRYNITQIAELCNFSDVYFFSRQFKEYMGLSPTQFIKKYKSSK